MEIDTGMWMFRDGLARQGLRGLTARPWRRCGRRHRHAARGPPNRHERIVGPPGIGARTGPPRAPHVGIVPGGQGDGAALGAVSTCIALQDALGNANSSVNHGMVFLWNTVSRRKSTAARTDHFFATSR